MQWVALSPVFCVEFACSPRVSVGFFSGFSGFLSQSKDMQVRFIVDSKLPVGVNVSVNGCLSLCVSPVIVWRPVHGVPRLRPMSAVDNGWKHIGIGVWITFNWSHSEVFHSSSVSQFPWPKPNAFNSILFSCTVISVTAADSTCWIGWKASGRLEPTDVGHTDKTRPKDVHQRPQTVRRSTVGLVCHDL